MKKHKGFTLIESMIVIAIIGILAAVALPAYKNYITKAQLSEGLGFLSAVRVEAEVYYQNNGVWPHEGNPQPVSGKYFEFTQIWSRDALAAQRMVRIHAYIKAGAIANVPTDDLGKVIILEGVADVDGRIKWTCGQHPQSNRLVPLEALPPSCANTLVSL